MPRFAKKDMIAAIAYADEHTDEEAALGCRVQVSTILKWRTKLSKDFVVSPTPIIQNANKVLERDLSRWVSNRLHGGRRPTLVEISWKGLGIARRVGAREFVPTAGWGSFFLKRVKLLADWRSFLQNEREKRALSKGMLCHEAQTNLNVRKVKRRSKISVQDSFGHSNEQLTAWLTEKLERGERPTLKQISAKGLEIRKCYGGPEFIPSVQWAQQFMKIHGLLNEWSSSSDEVTKEEVANKHGKLMAEQHNMLMDEAIKYAELHGNQMAITKFNITAESFYEYLMRSCDTKPEFNPETVSSSTQEMAMNDNPGPCLNHELPKEIASSDVNSVGLKIKIAKGTLIESEEPEFVDQYQIPLDENKDQSQMPSRDKNQSLLPSCESSNNNQSCPSEVNEERNQSQNAVAMFCWTANNDEFLESHEFSQPEIFSSEIKDHNPTNHGTPRDWGHQMTSDNTDVAISLDHAEEMMDCKQNDSDKDPLRRTGYKRKPSRCTAKEKQELFAEAEYYKKMFHICKAMYENRKLPTGLPEEPKFVACNKLRKVKKTRKKLRDQLPLDKVLQAHHVLYNSLDENFERTFDIQREEEDTVKELMRLYKETKSHYPLPYYAAIGAILHEAEHNDAFFLSIGSAMRWGYNHMRSIIRIHFLCQKYPIFKYLRITLSGFIGNISRIKSIMGMKVCHGAWLEASRRRGLKFPTA